MSAPVLGIDLGSSNSCVAVHRNGKVSIIPDDEGNRIIPSYVAFTDSDYLIGTAAKNHAACNPANTIFDVKRLISCKFYAYTVQSNIRSWPFKIVNDDGNAKIKVQYKGEQRIFSPEEIITMLLARMKAIAEEYLGEKLQEAVITVPAYFNDAQIQVIKDAGANAGLIILQVISEPIAAAVAYGFRIETDDKRNVLTVDVGCRTSNFSVITSDLFHVKSFASSSFGGDDFDNRLVAHFVEYFYKKYEKDLKFDERAITRLRKACERVKRLLSFSNRQDIYVYNIVDDINFHSCVKRTFFEKLIQSYVVNMIYHIKNVLKEAKLKASDINDVILIGGSTNITLLQKTLQDFFGSSKIRKSIDPEIVVAYGAAIHGASLKEKMKEENKNRPDIATREEDNKDEARKFLTRALNEFIDKNYEEANKYLIIANHFQRNIGKNCCDLVHDESPIVTAKINVEQSRKEITTCQYKSNLNVDDKKTNQNTENLKEKSESKFSNEDLISFSDENFNTTAHNSSENVCQEETMSLFDQLLENSSEEEKNISKDHNKTVTTYKCSENLNSNDSIQAYECLEIARSALQTENFKKAEKFVNKSIRFCPTKHADDLLKQILTAKAKERTKEEVSVAENFKDKPKTPLNVPQPATTLKDAHREAIRRVQAAKNMYEILGVPETATLKEVEKARRKQMKLLHTDVNKEPGASQAFMAINEAAEQLEKLLNK